MHYPRFAFSRNGLPTVEPINPPTAQIGQRTDLSTIDIKTIASMYDSYWQSVATFTPPFHIAADGHGDLGVRFVDVNNDGQLDLIYHRWIGCCLRIMSR